MNGLEWMVVDAGRMQHAVPMEDTHEHFVDMACWCHPFVDDDSPFVVVHNSADGREAFERGMRKMS